MRTVLKDRVGRWGAHSRVYLSRDDLYNLSFWWSKWRVNCDVESRVFEVFGKGLGPDAPDCVSHRSISTWECCAQMYAWPYKRAHVDVGRVHVIQWNVF